MSKMTNKCLYSSNHAQVVVFQEHGRRNCAEDLDWDNHPALRDIKLCDRRSYRQQRLCQWLESECARRYGEDFASYLQRSYTLAYNYLRNVNRIHYGDEYPHLLDKFVYQLFTGSRMRQLKIGMLRDVETEELLLQFLREECKELVQEKALAIDPRKFNLPVTPPWPDPAEMARFERIKIPPKLTTLTEMDSR